MVGEMPDTLGLSTCARDGPRSPSDPDDCPVLPLVALAPWKTMVRGHEACLGGWMPGSNIAASADIDPRAEIGEGTVIWHGVHVREGARIGRDCVLGRGAYVD